MSMKTGYLIIIIMMFALITPVQVMAKSKTKLTTGSITITEDDSYAISLKGKNGKIKTKSIKWKVADVDIAVIAKKEKKQIRIKGKKTGTTRLIAKYKGKAYICKIKVLEIEEEREEDEEDANDATSNCKDKLDSQYKSDKEEVSKKIEDFKVRYITEGMTEHQKMDAVARYISSEYDYQARQENWMKMLIIGSGDCYASRFAVMMICRDIGLKAVACYCFEDHGKTIVRADGKIYLVITGYAGEKPRDYDIYELDDEAFDELAERNHIDKKYFNK